MGSYGNACPSIGAERPAGDFRAHAKAPDLVCPIFQPASWAYGRTGHLFENRYKSILCEEENYLLALVRYIHLNPVRAKLVKTMGELDRYPWSGHRMIIGKDEYPWMDRAYLLVQFASTRIYHRFMSWEIPPTPLYKRREYYLRTRSQTGQAPPVGFPPISQ
jgi:hypothetical protein